MIPDNEIVISRVSRLELDKKTLSQIRGRIFLKLDSRFFLIVTLSVIIHLVSIIYFTHSKVEEKDHIVIEQVPERFAKLIIDKPIEKTKKNQTDKKELKSTTETKTGEPKKTSGNVVLQKRNAQREVKTQVAQVEEKVRTVGVLGMLTGVGKTAKGPSVVDVLGTMKEQKNNFNDLDAVLEKMSGLKKNVSVDVLDRKLVKSKDVVISHKEEIDDLIASVGQATYVDLAKKGDFVIQRPERIEGAAATNAKRDPAAINEIVSSHRNSIKMSYEKFLKRNPELAGKISVIITITASGSVTDIVVTENTTGSPEFEQEIVRKIKMWQFDPIGDGDCTVSYPFVFMPAS
ncbi:MAG: energy transducer TonB [Fibrobacter sp.]|nr:energy transducer TonB [Fibrobacter sp.]